MAILPLSDVDIAIKLASLAISMHLILIPFSDVLHLFCYEQAKAMLLIKPPPALIVLLVALKHTIAMCEVIIPRPLIKVSIRIEKLSSSSLSIYNLALFFFFFCLFILDYLSFLSLFFYYYFYVSPAA